MRGIMTKKSMLYYKFESSVYNVESVEKTLQIKSTFFFVV